MAWFNGMLALLRTGMPDGLSWEQRKLLNRWIRRRGLGPRLASLQLEKVLGGPQLGPARALLDSISDRPLVFIISYQKTGTRSVHEYLERLGMRGLHWPVFVNCGVHYAELLQPYVGDPQRCVAALAPVLARFDFFGDVPFPGLHECLAETFPAGRFIVVEREPAKWWDSLSRHWNLSEGDRVLGALEAIQYGLPLGSVVKPSDRDALIRNYSEHLDAVNRTFAGSGRLLRTHLDAPEINRALSKFLGFAEVPDFPHIRAGAVHRSSDPSAGTSP